MKRLQFILISTVITLSSVSPTFCQTATFKLLGQERVIGPIEFSLHTTQTPTPGYSADLSVKYYSFQSNQQPAFHWPVLGGLAGKVIIDGLIIFYAGDIWHAFPPIILFDPLVTAFGVHAGNRYLGSFPLDALTSYGTFFLLTYLAYGVDLSSGSFEELGSYDAMYMSMGIQIISTVLIERLIGAKRIRTRR